MGSEPVEGTQAARIIQHTPFAEEESPSINAKFYNQRVRLQKRNAELAEAEIAEYKVTLNHECA